MNRREAIKKSVLMMGLSISSPMVISVLQSCEKTPSQEWETLTFDEDEMRLIKSLVDQILPKTDSPSATEVGVHKFVDKMVAEVYSAKERKKFKSDLKAVDLGSKKRNGKIFATLEDKEKYDLLFTLESSLKQFDYEAPLSDKPFFLKLKEMVLLGYFTSEVIMKNYLEYIPIPTKLEGCTPMQENQKLRVGNYFLG